MRVLVTASAHFAVTPDATLWAGNASLEYAFWSRYLEVYDRVDLLARAMPASKPPDGWVRATGPGIFGRPVPDFTGPWEYVRRYAAVRGVLRHAISEAHAIHLRIPCTIGSEIWKRLPSGRPYGLEVVADPFDSFAPGSVRHPLRPLFRRWFSAELRRQCRHALAAAYVTRRALQAAYPCPHYSVGFSDVRIDAGSMVAKPRAYDSPRRPFNLILVGSLAQFYKAPDVLLDATAECVRTGLDLRLVLVGDGAFRAELERRAQRLGIAGRVEFRGQLSAGAAVQAELDAADLFVLPSHQEGLPRALVEAMARALPAIGSTVGGIPELLDAEDLVPPGDAAALASRIREAVTNPGRLERMSARNLQTAQEYREELLAERRRGFYRHVRALTEEWLNRLLP
ncbi:MAG: glycosyltransferase family 4 protein [Acidobacteria bacterium]|nr:glycosyltransferase family 4 protein [Acidobacteriota bacterium]